MAKIILLDFDGVIHSYTSGWLGIDVIPDPPVPGALKFIENLIDDGRFEVCVYSSRSREAKGVEAMKKWFAEHGLSYSDLADLKFPIEKPPAWLTIDDRCLCFTGDFPSTEYINNFKPWYKRGR